MNGADDAARADLSVSLGEVPEGPGDAVGDGGQFDAQYDPSVDDSLTAVVVEAVARAADCDPLEVEPLYSVLDPDALESLFAPCGAGSRSGTVRFPLGGVRVTVVDGTGVRIDEE